MPIEDERRDEEVDAIKGGGLAPTGDERRDEEVDTVKGGGIAPTGEEVDTVKGGCVKDGVSDIVNLSHSTVTQQ